KYRLLKHYRGARTAPNEASMNPQEFDAHVRYMEEFAGGLRESGEYDDSQALSPEGTFVGPDGPGEPPVTDGRFAPTQALLAGWMAIDVDSYERALELAGELSAAPGAGGEPIQEWLELRPFWTDQPPTIE